MNDSVGVEGFVKSCCGAVALWLHQVRLIGQTPKPSNLSSLLRVWAGILPATILFFNTTQYDTQYRHSLFLPACLVTSLRPRFQIEPARR